MLFTRRSLTKLIVPLIFEQLLNVTIGMVDTIMVASCGEAAVSGISLVDSINILLINIFSALASGGAVVTAQYIGKGDIKEGCESANQLVISIVAVSAVISSAALIFRPAILHMVFGTIEPDVMNNALIYFMLSAFSYPFLALYNAGAALFRSMGNSKLSLYTSLVMNLINICGNALFIYGFDMGVLGAALATLISRICASLFMFIMIVNPHNIVHIENLLPLRINWGMVKNILRIGIPNGLENSMFQIGKVLVSSLVASFGTAAIAANAVAGNIASMQVIPGSAIGLALITVVGQCVGAKEFQQAKEYTFKLMLMNIAAVGLTSFIVCLNVRGIAGLYNLTDETADLAIKLMLIHGIFAPCIWTPSFSLPNALRAANDVKFTMIISILSMWFCRIMLSYILGRYMGLEVIGVYIAMICDWVVRSICFMWRFWKGKWMQKQYI